ncbi:MAG: phosphomannomutase/phosphoglucomutase [Candidatus Thermoplasmatota archaeon]|nr:phosphomannomutase/phosphoglucomutase [Candidatus Thermoplasmatota archaeon]
MSIFKAYDIRGIYPQEINEETAERLGRAIAKYFKTTVVAGRDTRISSLPLFKSFAKGVNAEGYDVVDIGIIDTPGLYFATAHYGFGCGVMITASHNPKEYNGLKICREAAIPVGSDSGLKDIEEIFNAVPTGTEKEGKIIEKDVLDDYADHLMHLYKGSKRKALVDCSNGATARIVKKLIEKGIALEVINDEMDGNFPAHEPDPLKEENLQQLKDNMNDVDIGICFDGDGDRVGVISQQETIRNDFITAIIAKDLLKTHKGETMLYDLRSSRVVREEIEKAGGRAVMCRVGHAFIKKQMREENALFAGELSGHFYYRENYFADSGPITMLTLLGMENIETGSLKRYFPSGEINVKTMDPQAALKRIEERFAGKGSISYLDGISFECEDYWFNARASNTEPLVRINVESGNKERTRAVVRLLLDLLRD